MTTSPRLLGGTTLAAVPAHNELGVAAVLAGLRGSVDSLLLIDDGSVPPLAPHFPGLLLSRSDHNLGYGDCLQIGIDYARDHGYERLVFVDADGQHDTAYAAELLTELDTADAVVGTRFDRESEVRGLPQPALRREANMFFLELLRRFVPEIGLTDFFSGFLAFRVAQIPASLDLRGSRYASHVRLWPCLLGAGYVPVEIPVPCIYNHDRPTFLRQYRSASAFAHLLLAEFSMACQAHLLISHDHFAKTVTHSFGSGSYPLMKSLLGGDE